MTLLLQLGVGIVMIQLASSQTLWADTANIHGPGGVPQSAADVAACKKACIDDSNCVAIDWEPNNSGKECWILQVSYTGPTTADGHITHYELDRSAIMARSCSELYTGGGLQHNANVEIDTDGPGGPAQPFTAYCEINGTTAYTIIHTVEETETEVNGYEDTCQFYRAVRYMDTARNAIDISQLIPLVDSSTTCRQLVRWRCRHSIISWNSKTYTYLHNRNGEPMAYFGNATYRSAGSPLRVMCACGETDSCGAPGRLCHCDTNDLVWRTDEGYITHRPDLPVKAFCAGDTGHSNEQGYYVVGPLICS